MRAQLIVVFVMEALDRRVLDRAVHALDLAIRPRVVRLGQSMLDTVGLTDDVEAHWPGIDGVPVSGLLGELNAIIGQYGVDLKGHSFENVLQELPGRLSIAVATSWATANLAVQSMPTNM